MRKGYRIGIVPIVFLLFFSCAAAGTLDRSFNAPYGFRLHKAPHGGPLEAWAILPLANGNIQVAGTISNWDTLFTQYLPGGKINASFGKDGMVPFRLGPRHTEARIWDMAVTPDGNIVAAGHIIQDTAYGAIGAKFDLLVIMMTPGGEPVTTFGENGTLRRLLAEGSNEDGRSVTLQPDGKILVCGRAGPDIATKMIQSNIMLRRFHADGRNDSSFAGSGRFILKGNGRAMGNKVIVDPDAGIVMVGESQNDAIIVRLSWDGTLDPAFGQGGSVLIDLGANERLTDAAIMVDGHILAVGVKQKGTQKSELLLARFTPDGVLDSTFGIDGILLAEAGSFLQYKVALAVGPSNRIFIVGGSRQAEGAGSFLAEFDAQKQAFRKWSIGNMTGMPLLTPEQSLATDIAVQADGKLVVCGFAEIRYPPKDSDPQDGDDLGDFPPGPQGRIEAYVLRLQP